jgi:hypothetical protein
MKTLLSLIILATVACAAPVLPEEALARVGEIGSVRGLVEQVSFSSKGNAFLNSGIPGKLSQASSLRRALSGGESFLRSLAGNPVTIIGRIGLFKGRPEIVISEATQIAQ